MLTTGAFDIGDAHAKALAARACAEFLAIPDPVTEEKRISLDGQVQLVEYGVPSRRLRPNGLCASYARAEAGGKERVTDGRRTGEMTIDTLHRAGVSPEDEPGGPMAAIGALDPLYFDDAKTWEQRRASWRSGPRDEFWIANNRDLANRLAHKPGAHAVINIGAHALLRVLRGQRYKNAYLLAKEAGTTSYAVIGATPASGVEAERKTVDAAFGLNPPEEYFFAAVSLEGAGVRYYGEYCMELRNPPPPSTQIVDRDTYEVLFEPLASLNRASLVKALTGLWGPDLCPMAALKISHVLDRSDRITTNVVQARAILNGEEYLEIHLRVPPDPALGAGIGIDKIAGVRQDARDVAAAERIDTVFASGVRPRTEEILFSLRRRSVERAFAEEGLRTRIVCEERGT